MINTLAPLGATHTIVLSLAYGDAPTIPPAHDTAETKAAVVPQTTVTVTAYLKPKDGKAGEPKTLQFEGPVSEVDTALKEQLPLAVQKITQHLSTLAALDAQLAAEQAAKKKDNDAKAASPGKEVTPPAGKKSRTVYPATSGSSAKPAEAAKEEPKPAEDKKGKAAAASKPTSAAEALKRVKDAAASAPAPAVSMANVPAAVATPASAAADPEPAPTPAPAPAAEPDPLAALAAALPKDDDAVDL